MSKTLLALVALLCCYSVASATETLTYSVNLWHTERHEVEVRVFPNGFKGKKLTYQMPVWAPGAYSVTNYGRFVKNFRAYDVGDNELATTKVDDNRWEVADGKKVARLSYSVVNSYKDSTSLYFALLHSDTNYFFANATALFGYVNDKKNIHSTVTYLLPAVLSWKLYCPLDSTVNSLEYKSGHNLTFKAVNYDELVDAPVMGGTGIKFRSFEQDGAEYEVALVNSELIPIDSLTESLKQVIKCQTDFFGDIPFKRYQFLINAPNFTKLPVQNGLGALEHANSSAYLLFDAEWPVFKQNALNVFSHEFFHLWNVKRIHSTKLGPFDYAHRVKTTSLWLSEGITDYYANSLLSRCGILPAVEFERKITEWYSTMKTLGVTANETLEQLSIEESELDLQKAYAFYTKAPLVALMLDLHIRKETQNSRSLDNVMAALYAKAKKKQFFKDEDLIKQMGKIVGLDLIPFYKEYIAGKKELDLDKYLHQLDLQFDPGTSGSSTIERIPDVHASNIFRHGIYGG